MITAWKKFLNKNETNLITSSNANGENSYPPGIHKLDKGLQKKFRQGVNYNLKVVIKGDTRVGKTALFKRLEGHDFEDNYPPTENLTVTSIDWSYKASDDIVKVDLWEAVDPIWRKGDTQRELKLNNDETNGKASPEAPKNTISQARLALNHIKSPIPEEARQSLAELVDTMDVYKGADAILLVFDMTKLWTFKYAQAELAKIPRHIPVLVIANNRDQGHHRTVSHEQAVSFISGLERNPGDALVMYTEASMKNGFGLNMIKKFFSIPFLKLQEASLLKQVELNRYEYLNTLEELEMISESVDRDYENHLELRTLIRRQQADAMSPINSGFAQLDERTREKIRNTRVSSDEVGIDLSQVKSIESSQANGDLDIKSARVLAEKKFVHDRLPSIVIGAKCSLPESKKVIMTRNESQTKENQISDDSDEEEIPKANPLVASYQSDLDSDDQTGKDE